MSFFKGGVIVVPKLQLESDLLYFDYLNLILWCLCRSWLWDWQDWCKVVLSIKTKCD